MQAGNLDLQAGTSIYDEARGTHQQGDSGIDMKM